MTSIYKLEIVAVGRGCKALTKIIIMNLQLIAKGVMLYQMSPIALAAFVCTVTLDSYLPGLIFTRIHIYPD